jgi:hypothetical protein
MKGCVEVAVCKSHALADRNGYHDRFTSFGHGRLALVNNSLSNNRCSHSGASVSYKGALMKLVSIWCTCTSGSVSWPWVLRCSQDCKRWHICAREKVLYIYVHWRWCKSFVASSYMSLWCIFTCFKLKVKHSMYFCSCRFVSANCNIDMAKGSGSWPWFLFIFVCSTLECEFPEFLFQNEEHTLSWGAWIPCSTLWCYCGVAAAVSLGKAFKCISENLFTRRYFKTKGVWVGSVCCSLSERLHVCVLSCPLFSVLFSLLSCVQGRSWW